MSPHRVLDAEEELLLAEGETFDEVVDATDEDDDDDNNDTVQQPVVVVDRPARRWVLGSAAFEHQTQHHKSAGALWNLKWRELASRGMHPFEGGVYEDFRGTFELFNQFSVKPTSTEYTRVWLPIGELAYAKGNILYEKGRCTEAEEYFRRAAAIFRIARQPHVSAVDKHRFPLRFKAWESQKETYLRAGKLWIVRLRDLQVPFHHMLEHEDDLVHMYLRRPLSASWSEPCPVVILLSGLDTLRTDHTSRTNAILARGWVSIALDVPGTGDCPADPSDVTSMDRVFDSVLDYLQRDGRYDMKSILVWGRGLGGYYAVRLAHTRREKLLGVVAHGAGTHNFLDRDWLSRAQHHEFPFAYNESLASAFGYRTVSQLMEEGQNKFSLLRNLVLDGESTPLLFVNGVEDGLMPIEDSIMVVNKGSPREGRQV
ncbi:hypothetical protein S7711_08580 [Stachybotrys chartarum IBT 7711]|uniref:AB hydrolase-1 domain-containing protein n=1 Tax=Stachybotrys chartarum (strain CBS 109288 / IBT 7711) TaxID=1280523 RepID=A0A084AJG8_STACB|nr:hypothetical protein S7711_08580 [Stachybotrys chartarum IBT 7711]KFA53596.1 hypothetical protein S40293_07509 [Stachybotrys chartarum IBT 40293]